jgi:hypothetical protein
MSGGATLTVNGPVQVYLMADSSLSGNGIINTTLKAANFQIFSSVSSTTKGVAITGGSAAYATVYAPNAYVKFTGGSDFFGSVVGGCPAGTSPTSCIGIDDNGGTNIHYDKALNGLVGSGLGRLTWRQLL